MATLNPLRWVTTRLRSAFSLGLSSFVGNLASGSRRFGREFKKRLVADIIALVGIALVALLLVVAAVLFIIFTVYVVNTSGFVTPRGTMRSGIFSGGPVTNCTPEYEPLSFPNTAADPTTSRSWAIINNLHRGFWCFWNRSPDYPELFDNAAFQANPNPDPTYVETHGLNMFWCTWLIIKSYQETGVGICPDCLYVPNMRLWFESQGRYIPATTALVNLSRIKPGDVVFIAKDNSSRGVQGDHVGIVWQVNPDAIITVESNNSVKSASYTISGNTARWFNLFIIGFGSR
jgi:hypothetical protein